MIQAYSIGHILSHKASWIESLSHLIMLVDGKVVCTIFLHFAADPLLILDLKAKIGLEKL